MRSNNLIYLVALILLILIPAAGAVASLTWFDDMENSVCITAIDTNFDASLILVGLGNGTILAYDNNNTILWAVNTNASVINASIKKIAADINGNIAWINKGNQSGFISSTGTRGNATATPTDRNFTDVAIDDDGTYYATTEMPSGTLPSRVILHYQNGNEYAQNTSFNFANWTRIGYDPLGEWLVTANQSDDTLYFWNVSQWVGWEQFNPTYTASKNVTQSFIDSFPYRVNISVNATNTTGITFYNASNVTGSIIKVNNSFYFYNRSKMGTYFYWTTPGNLSNMSNVSGGVALENQSQFLNLSNISGTTSYKVVLKPGFRNYTIYYGNLSYSNVVLNQTYVTVNITSNQSWSVPSDVSSVNITMYGGGGGGSGGYNQPWFQIYYPSTYYKGYGGYAASMTSYANVPVTPGGSVAVVIGNGGAAGVANSSAGGGKGTNSSFGSYNATGGEPGVSWVSDGTNGVNGNTSIAGYPTAGTGGTGDMAIYNSGCQHYTGTGDDPTTPGSGYGAGGAGGGFGCKEYTHGCGGYAGAGGTGAAGVVSITYPVYYYGNTVDTTSNATEQTRQSAIALNQSSSKDYVGTILGISVPRSGGSAGLVTDTIFYNQYISNTGFGLTYCATLTGGSPALFAGTPYTVSSSNSGAATVEGRGAYGNIYDAGGVAKASSLTGGTIRSADVAMTSGVFAAFGGDEGKLYMLSRQGSSTWYSFYTGAAGTAYNAIAVSWDGAVVVAGRFGGTLEYYDTNVTIPVTPTIGYADASVYVFKDGAEYEFQPVTIYSSESDITNWTPVTTLTTDSSGKITYTTTVGTYYKFVVNNVVGTTEGEASKIWQSNSASTTIYMYVLSPSTPYEWNAYYNAGTHNVTVVYSDSITPTSVTVTIKDLKTNLVVLTRTYTATSSFTLEYHDTLQNGTYQVNILITRLGSSIRDQRIVTSPDTYGITLPVDKYIIYAISTIILMIIAGLFGYANSRRGAFAVVIIAGLFIWFGLLPMSMMVIAMLAAIFAVMSLFASRVQ